MRPARYISLLCLSVCLVACPAWGGVEFEEDDDRVAHYRLTVSPAAETMAPRLVTPVLETVAGNAALHYYRLHTFDSVDATSKSGRDLYGEAFDGWYSLRGTPIEKLPLDDMRVAASWFEQSVRAFLEPAARCRECVWGVDQASLRGEETIQYMLPELQYQRGAARLLAIQTRLAIAEGRYDDAVRLLRIGFHMARDTGDAPFIVCGLVGGAIAGINFDAATELIAAPDSPNLYWALSELPDPLVPMRETMRFGLTLGPRVLPLIENAETAVRAPEEWNRLFREACVTLVSVSGEGLFRRPLEEFSPLLAGTAGYTHAKRRLVDWGFDANRVEAMPIGQVIAIYSARVYQRLADAALKPWLVPSSEALPLARAAEELLYNCTQPDNPDREVLPVASLLLPASTAARTVEVRTARRLAVLRLIEALRMHAAETGSLPDSLDEVSVVPVPENPATGEPFDYQLSEGSAVISVEEYGGYGAPAEEYTITLRE
ncbi:hypothetical protein Mal64_32420 [Pseudobythopirellula maris]|uniref:Tetratricopeptide repeat protein n=1 Tax=Pseudobythopirellula maris TaxID=2527991 RepID=A0A5C5ZJY2_9BACT|nr:hypothetical protein [Pseudobythopirellula maris]TWT87699.1 hypothetical protein Mal64_32420 [Pseudobythopirellula maris]